MTKVTEIKITPPPPPPTPSAPQVIEVVRRKCRDDYRRDRSGRDHRSKGNRKVVEDDDDIEVPFAIIEDIPIFPGCEKVSKKSNATVFRKKSINTLEITLDTEIAQEMGIQGFM